MGGAGGALLSRSSKKRSQTDTRDGPGFSPLEAWLFVPLRSAGLVLFNRDTSEMSCIDREMGSHNIFDNSG